MTPNEAHTIIKARVDASPAFKDDLTAAWNRICDAIEARALARRPKPAAFEVRHETETARAALFVAVASGKPLPDGEAIACNAVGI